MTSDWESTFSFWSQPPSKTEQERCERVINAIRKAVANSHKLQTKRILVFTQGSFRNRVNVRQDSDVDVGVMLYECFLTEYPAGKSNADFATYDVDYGFTQFKNELEEALVAYFGRSVVTRGNKAFDIKAASSQVEADVVPLMEFRQYWDNGKYRAGVALITDKDGRRIENYPERLLDTWPITPLHYENGISKNTATNRRFKGLTRILKKLCNEMGAAGNVAAQNVPSYLLECLVWNTPNPCFNHDTWEDRLQSVLRFLWQNTKEDSLCSNWLEVDAVKYLFHVSQPWTRQQAHDFINVAWDTVGVKP